MATLFYRIQQQRIWVGGRDVWPQEWGRIGCVGRLRVGFWIGKDMSAVVGYWIKCGDVFDMIDWSLELGWKIQFEGSGIE